MFGRELFRSSVVSERHQATWRPEGVFLPLDGTLPFTARLDDHDERGRDSVIVASFGPEALESGVFEARTRRGSLLRLEFGPAPAPHDATAVRPVP